VSDTLTLTIDGTDGGTAAYRTFPRRLGPVILDQEIGRGAMGVVFRGWHDILGRDVAVKLFLHTPTDKEKSYLDRFRAEGRAAAAVRHTNLTMIHHADLAYGIPYLVMDFIDGPALSAVLLQVGGLSIDSALVAALAMSDGVAALHRSGIVHRDIKPRNTLLDCDGNIFVTDFGLAITRNQTRSLMTPSGVRGTPAYMAPEMFEGLVSERSDVYALGIATFELITGSAPFGGSLAELQWQHTTKPLPIAALEGLGVSKAIIEVLERATHRNTMYRFKTAEHFRLALEEVTNEGQRTAGRAALREIVERTRTEATPVTVDSGSSATATTTYVALLQQMASQKRWRRSEESTQESSCTSQEPQASLDVGADVRGIDDGPRRILRLLWCPQCGYDLRTLPRRHRCPECGLEYTPSLFALYGWAPKDRFSIAGRLLIGTWHERLLAIALVMFVAIHIGSRLFEFRTIRSWVPPALLFVFFVSRLYRLRYPRTQPDRAEQSGSTQLLCTSEGASIRLGPGQARAYPWKRFRKLRFRRLWFHKRKRDAWLLELRIPFWQYFGYHPIALILECTLREAALVRNELRRRIRGAATVEKKGHTPSGSGCCP